MAVPVYKQDAEEVRAKLKGGARDGQALEAELT